MSMSSRKITQGLNGQATIVDEIARVGIKSAKVIGACNIGKGH